MPGLRVSLPFRRLSVVAIFVLLACLPAALPAADTPNPTSVTVAGSLQSELGCPGDWQPDCVATHLSFDAEDGVWQGVFAVPAGSWEYKAALNDSWDENYGTNAQRNGGNIPLDLGAETGVKFYYAHATHWITDGVNATIAVAPGNFQSELGCANDWDPSCLRSWLQDPDGDSTYTFRTRALPAGSYEAKVAIAESWDLNYGDGGVQNGANIPFTVPADCTEMLFSWDGTSHVLTIGVAPPLPEPSAVTVAGSLQSELGCSGDWQPDCAATHLGFDAEDGVWQGVFAVPAGSWEYKAPLNDSWSENYGANAQRDGANIALNLAAVTDVKFYYSHQSHWITDDQGFLIATAPGSYQSEIGCGGDWDPGCLRSWLQDPDGDGILSFSAWLPAGSYEVKAAHNESWDVNYGEGGVQNGPNIPFTVARSCTEVFFTYNALSHVLTVGTGPGGPQGNLNQAKAHWVSEDTLAWNAGSAADSFRLHYAADGGLALDESGVVGGSSLPLTVDPAGLTAEVLAKFPHLAGYKALKLAASDLGLVPDLLKGQLAVAVASSGGDPLDATGVQVPGVLDDLYTYDGPLGVSFAAGVPTLRLWAPTARSVTLQLFADSDPATTPSAYPMLLDPATGVWSVSGSAGWNRRYYAYDVEVYAPSTQQVELNRVTDPYSLSLSTDSRRSQIVNLADGDLKPPGWDHLAKPALAQPEDITLYELHVRDFSIADPTVPEPLRGTFRAFGVAGSQGMRHLRSLARAGLTHVHILPSFDFATVPEDRAEQLSVDPAVLATYPPDSDQQQAAVAAVQNQDGFNWGYDPWHYTVPEGSYATDPDGPARIKEYRQMVRGLAQAGLRTVMDVVYNHTTASGQNAKSVLDRIVPGYYHRLSLSGSLETSSCCANTASEHAMMEKLLIDSVLTWATAYKVDGFRFDLMGHHMKANMLKLRAALDGLTLAHDGVDGSRVYLYGEGWNFGEVANNARGVNATQANMAGTGIGTFSDRLRDGVRGGNPFSDIRAQGFINGLGYDPNDFPQGDAVATLLHVSDWIKSGLAGGLAAYQLIDEHGDLVAASQIDYFGQPAGYTADPQEYITYIAAHDNETLFDATALKAPATTSMADRVRIQDLGASLVALGQGIPFFHAAEELLRSKSMDRDSYNSGDWFNAIDWSGATTNWGHGLPIADKNQANWPLMQPLLADPALEPAPSDIARSADHLREVLAIRKSSRLFRLGTAAAIEDRLHFENVGLGQVPGLIVMRLADPDGAFDRGRREIVTFFNARNEAVSFALPDLAGEVVTLHPVLATSSDPVVRTASFAAGTFAVPARTTAVFGVQRPAAEQIALLLADVQALADAGELHGGQAQALRVLLNGALDRLEHGQTRAAAVLLKAFTALVKAYQLTGILPPSTAQELIANAETAIAAL